MLFEYYRAVSVLRSPFLNSGLLSKPDWSDINVVIFVSTGRTDREARQCVYDPCIHADQRNGDCVEGECCQVVSAEI